MKITYFPFRARGETARLTLFVASIPFEDERVEFSQWPSLKSKTPLGQIPVLTIDDTTKIGQSSAIVRYAGRLSGLYPVDPLEAALVDQAYFQVSDVMDAVFLTLSVEEDKKAEARAKLAAEKLPKLLEPLDQVFATHGGKYAVGDKLTIADVHTYVMADIFKSGAVDHLDVDLIDKYPNISKVYQTFKKHPRVVEWESNHPQTL